MSATAPRVRRIRAGEAPVLRAVRLRALSDTPLAFGSTHAREAAYPPARWEQWARDGAASPTQATFLAVATDADEPVGLAVAVIDADDPHSAHLFSMWVAPEARGTGAATALLEAVVDWTTAQGARTLRTQVTTGNEPAARLYSGAGFLDSGRREPLGHSDAETKLLERALDP